MLLRDNREHRGLNLKRMEGLDEGKSIDGDRKLDFYFAVCSFYAMKSLTLVYQFCDDIVIEEERKSI